MIGELALRAARCALRVRCARASLRARSRVCGSLSLSLLPFRSEGAVRDVESLHEGLH